MIVYVITDPEGCWGVYSTRENAIARIKKMEYWENAPADWAYDHDTSDYEIEEWVVDEGPMYLESPANGGT